MSPKFTLPLLFLVAPTVSLFAGEKIVRDDFERLAFAPNARAYSDGAGRAQRVSVPAMPEAAGSVQGSQGAFLLQGGVESGWKPALEYRVPHLQGSWLRVAFHVRQISIENSQLGLHIVNGPSPFYIWASMDLNPGFVRVRNVGQGLAKGISHGADAGWHRIEWILPLPGNPSEEALFNFDGQGHEVIPFRPVSPETPDINIIRFWSPRAPNTTDMRYLIDNVEIETLDQLPH